MRPTSRRSRSRASTGRLLNRRRTRRVLRSAITVLTPPRIEGGAGYRAPPRAGSKAGRCDPWDTSTRSEAFNGNLNSNVLDGVQFGGRSVTVLRTFGWAVAAAYAGLATDDCSLLRQRNGQSFKPFLIELHPPTLA